MVGRKRLRVAILGIPNDPYYLKKKAYGNYLHAIERRLTKGIWYKRKRMNILSPTAELEKYGIKLEVNNLGQIIPKTKLSKREIKARQQSKRKEHISRVIYRKQLDAIKRKLQKIGKEYDEIIIIGGSHEAAYPMYSQPGKVAYIDQHFDAYSKNKAACSGYLGYILKRKIKTPGQIVASGQGISAREKAEENQIEVVKPWDLKNKKADILDIDVDAFPAYKYDINDKKIYGKLSLSYSEGVESGPMGYNKMQVADVGKFIINQKPKIIGVFEINPEKESEIRLKQMLKGYANLAVLAAAERKFGIKILKPTTESRLKYNEVGKKD